MSRPVLVQRAKQLRVPIYLDKMYCTEIWEMSVDREGALQGSLHIVWTSILPIVHQTDAICCLQHRVPTHCTTNMLGNMLYTH